MDRIQKIRKHKNYWALPRVKEFWNVADRLSIIAKSGLPTSKDEAFLDKVERELEHLNPGTRLMIIEGQTKEVFTLYLGNDEQP